VKVINILEQLNQKPIQYYEIYSKIVGSITSGVLLSYLISLWYKNKEQPFSITDKDLCNILCLGKYELKKAKNDITKLEIIQTSRQGLPARTHYTINPDLLIDLILNRLEKV